MGNHLLNGLPPSKHPLENPEIPKVKAEADLCRAFTIGFHFQSIGANADDLSKLVKTMDSVCPEYGRWCGAGFAYSHAGFDRTAATEDWFMFLETGDCKLKHERGNGE